VLIYTSIAFSAWHISSATLDTDFRPAPSQLPVLLVNAAMLGIVWGILRWISGSIIVSSGSHGLWNGIAYVFFGFGSKTGVLGIRNTGIFGPEIGVLGLVINGCLRCFSGDGGDAWLNRTQPDRVSRKP
jgi:CAAX protease family protein